MKKGTDGVIMGNGGASDKSIGFSIKCKDPGKLFVELLNMDGIWSTKDNLISINLDEWLHMTVTWSAAEGLDVYLNGCAARHATQGPRLLDYM